MLPSLFYKLIRKVGPCLVLIVVLSTESCAEKHGTYFEFFSNPLNDRVSIDYELSSYNEDQKKFVTSTYSKNIDPKRTALVIIDLWPPKFLDSLTIKYINPLIKEVDSLGMKIIYSPSSGPLNRHLEILDDGIFFFNQDMMDKYLLDNNIENLIYVGYDTLYCVLDKPNGIFSYLARNGHEIEMFALDIGLLSSTAEMKTMAIELLKKNRIGFIKNCKIKAPKNFPENTLTDVMAKVQNETKSGSHFAIIFKKDTISQEFNEFKQKLVENNIDYAEVVENKMIYHGQMIPPHKFIRVLRSGQFGNIYYAGYHINNEILWSDFGLITLYIKLRYNKVPLPRLYVLNDLSFAVASDGISPEMEKSTIINHYHGLNNIMSSTLLEETEKQTDSSQTGPSTESTTNN